MLCGKWEKLRGGSAYLHELHGIKRKAAADKGGDFRQPDRFGKEPLQPERYISPDDGSYIVLINGRVVLTDSIRV